MATLLIIDDERNLLYSVKKSLESDDLQVVTAQSGREGLKCLRQAPFDAVILDLRLPDMTGMDVFAQIREADARLPVVLITAYSSSDTAIEAMKRGAFEYLVKPVDLERLRSIVGKALETSRMSHVPATYDVEDDALDSDCIVGNSPAMQDVFKAIGRVAPQNVNVLILGESGAGKELVARAIYQHSARSTGPFLAINCAALSETLLESELFGHEQGAFTGADRRRIGKFEQVDGGTIFLDEIGDMSPATQGKVLRLLQDGSLQRVGSNETIHVDVRVIAATHRNLANMTETGLFRSDLYYRLKVFAVELPPLRERTDDIPRLCEHFRRALNRSLNKSVTRFTPEAMEHLVRHRWSGNVRELQSAIKYAMVLAPGDSITPESLPESCRAGDDRESEASPMSGGSSEFLKHTVRRLLSQGDTDIYRKIHLSVDAILLRELLDHVGGNQTQASQLLGISRSTLHARINELGLVMEKRVI